MLEKKLSGTTFDLSGDVVAKQEEVLRLHLNYVQLVKDSETHYQSVKETSIKFEVSLTKIRAQVELLRNGWIDFAKELCKENSVLSTGTNWYFHLTTWSKTLDALDNSLDICIKTKERVSSVVHDFSLLLWNFSSLPVNFFTLYGNLSAGIIDSDGESSNGLVRLGNGLRKWRLSHPTWDLGEKFQCQIRCTSGGNRTRDYGANQPYKDHGLAIQKDLFGPENLVKQPGAEDWQNGVAELDVCRDRPHRWQLTSDGCWMPGGDCLLYDVFSSYISVPEGRIRQSTHFGWTLLDTAPARARTPGQPEQSTTRTTSDEFQFYQWRVKFPRAFSSEEIVVRPWIMDLDMSPPPNPGTPKLEGDNLIDMKFTWNTSKQGITFLIKEISATGYTIQTCCLQTASLRNVKIGFMASERNVPGLFSSLHTREILSAEQRLPPPLHKYTPELVPFPKGVFIRQPAIAPMLRGFFVDSRWNSRLNFEYGVSRDGVVVNGSSWSDTTLYKAEWEIIAIGTEPQT